LRFKRYAVAYNRTGANPWTSHAASNHMINTPTKPGSLDLSDILFGLSICPSPPPLTALYCRLQLCPSCFVLSMSTLLLLQYFFKRFLPLNKGLPCHAYADAMQEKPYPLMPPDMPAFAVRDQRPDAHAVQLSQPLQRQLQHYHGSSHDLVDHLKRPFLGSDMYQSKVSPLASF